MNLSSGMQKIQTLFAALGSLTAQVLRLFWFLISTIANGLRGPFYVKQIISQLSYMLYFSIPLVGMTALFTGMVLALQSYTSFSRFAAESALPEVVALSMTRELAPVLTALMMAGRWGASMAAELATMRVTDQLDALISLSTHPQRYLVIPRLLGATIALPCLTFLADIIGIVGGYIVGVYRCHLHGPQYIAKTFDVLLMTDVTSGLFKATCFGFIIGLVGCYQGYYASRGAEGVGIATTQGVVRASVMVLVANYVLTSVFIAK